MTPQERQLISELFDRLASVENSPRDSEAEKAIIEGLRRAPNAAYALVQTALVQDEALKRANTHIEELESRLQTQTQAPPASSGSFLDSMRDAVFGQSQSRGSVPNVRPAEAGAPRGAVWNSGQVLNNGYPDPRAAGYGAGYPPPQPGYPGGLFGGGGGGSSFLGTAAATAAGVVGGSLLMNSIRGLMGGGHQTFVDNSTTLFDDSRVESRSPWAGDQSNSQLARDAGLNDIDRADQRDEDHRQDQLQDEEDQRQDQRQDQRDGFFDNASNNDTGNQGGFGDDDGFGSDDGGGGDSDFA